MITSIHTLIYSDDAPATRAFLRDVLGWPYVEDAAGRRPRLADLQDRADEMGVTRPTASTMAKLRGAAAPSDLPDVRRHLHTVAELKGKGAEFRGEVQDHGYGLVVMMAVPGADDIMLYEPKHPLAS